MQSTSGSTLCSIPRVVLAFRAMLWLYIACMLAFVCTLRHCRVLVHSACSSAVAAIACRLPGSWVDRRLQRSISAQRLEDGSLLLQEHVVSPDGSRCAGGQRCTRQAGRAPVACCSSLGLQLSKRGPLQCPSCFQPAAAGAAHLRPAKWLSRPHQATLQSLLACGAATSCCHFRPHIATHLPWPLPPKVL